MLIFQSLLLLDNGEADFTNFAYNLIIIYRGGHHEQIGRMEEGIRLLTITFDFYSSLALQFSYIMVRLSDDMFLFPLASD